MPRTINRIILHCTATEAGRPLPREELHDWHVRERGWSDIGYHWVVDWDASVYPGRPESAIGAHCAGHNHDSIGLAYVGGLLNGVPSDTRTPEQVEAMDREIAGIRERYGQHVTVHGHNEYTAKACPSFQVKEDRCLRRR